MLPSKIADTLTKLRTKTESGELIWDYNDENSTVSLNQAEFQITLKYSFNETEEVGQFGISYFDPNTNKEYYFSTSQNFRDYEIARQLFDSAQSSGLNINI